jgi:YEATS domain-containing protein 4
MDAGSALSPQTRIPDTAVAMPIVYGSCAFYLGKKSHETATHKWTLFVRGPKNEDISVYISKVAFSLHESFAEPVRVLESPPYEVTELGWGEFAAKIRIFFRDPEEQPVDIVHVIKLYPQNMQHSSSAQQQGATAMQQNLKKPVISETYDEIVFVEPTVRFRQLLLSCVPSEAAAAPVNPLAEFYTQFDEERDVLAITNAHQHIQRELQLAKARLAALDSEAAFLQGGA